MKVKIRTEEQTASMEYKVEQLAKRQRQQYQSVRWLKTKVHRPPLGRPPNIDSAYAYNDMIESVTLLPVAPSRPGPPTIHLLAHCAAPCAKLAYVGGRCDRASWGIEHATFNYIHKQLKCAG
jgi:hypothetical protein